MDYDDYLIRLIDLTKNGQLVWSLESTYKFSKDYASYYIKNGENKLVVVKLRDVQWDDDGFSYESFKFFLLACDNNLNIYSNIMESELKNPENLQRLYRIIERKNNHFDDILRGFVDYV